MTHSTQQNMTLSDFLYGKDLPDWALAIVADHGPHGGFKESSSWYDDQNVCSTCSYEVTLTTEDLLTQIQTGQPVGRLGAQLRRVAYPCLTLRNLAEPFADDPQFREDWKTI